MPTAATEHRNAVTRSTPVNGMRSPGKHSMSLLRWHANLFILFRRLAHLSWSLLTAMPIQYVARSRMHMEVITFRHSSMTICSAMAHSAALMPRSSFGRRSSSRWSVLTNQTGRLSSVSTSISRVWPKISQNYINPFRKPVYGSS